MNVYICENFIKISITKKMMLHVILLFSTVPYAIWHVCIADTPEAVVEIIIELVDSVTVNPLLPV
jgi:hypothetical protein